MRLHRANFALFFFFAANSCVFACTGHRKIQFRRTTRLPSPRPSPLVPLFPKTLLSPARSPPPHCDRIESKTKCLCKGSGLLSSPSNRGGGGFERGVRLRHRTSLLCAARTQCETTLLRCAQRCKYYKQIHIFSTLLLTLTVHYLCFLYLHRHDDERCKGKAGMQALVGEAEAPSQKLR